MKKITYSISFIIIIVFVLAIVVFFSFIKNAEEARFIEIADTLTEQISETYNLWLNDQIRMAKLISNDELVIDVCTNPTDEIKLNEVEKHLVKIHQTYPYYENIPIAIKTELPLKRIVNGEEVIIENGTFLIDTLSGTLVGKGGVKYSYIKEIFDGKDYFVSEIYKSIYTQSPILVISVPVYNNSEVVGIVLLTPKMDYFTKLFVDTIELYDTGNMMFLDDRGEIIAHKKREYILTKDQDILNISKDIISKLNNKEYFFKEEYLGKNKYYYGQKVTNDYFHTKYSNYVVFTQEVDEILDGIFDFLLPIVLLGFISASITIYLLITITNSLHNKIREKELIEINSSLESKVEERTRQLKELANRDGLTGLYNHQYIQSKLKEIINEKNTYKPVQLLLTDLDHFKLVNDTYGHPIGDEVLVKVSDIFRENFRKNELIARYGGEEFLIILPNCNSKDGLAIAERVRKDIEDAVFSKSTLKVTISIGLTELRDDNALEIITRADNLLYKAKNSGRNKIVTS